MWSTAAALGHCPTGRRVSQEDLSRLWSHRRSEAVYADRRAAIAPERHVVKGIAILMGSKTEAARGGLGRGGSEAEAIQPSHSAHPHAHPLMHPLILASYIMPHIR